MLHCLWKDASHFESGKGLEQGVEWNGTLALRNLLEKSESVDVHSTDAFDQLIQADMDSWPNQPITWLELFMTGGYWTNERYARTNPERSMKCDRCGALVEDAFHLFWECPENLEINSKHILDSQNLVSQARAGKDQLPCLWLRGLLPASVMPNNTPYIDQDDISYVGSPPHHQAWPSGSYFADASGGEYSSLPVLRRCGVGVCVLKQYYNIAEEDPDQPMLWGIFAPLTGKVHTVVRAELYAVLLIARNLVVAALACVSSDSKVDVDLFDQGKAACMNSTNADLWNELFDLIESKKLNFTIRWVKGHCNSVEIAAKYHVSLNDIVGNFIADALAARAADVYKPIAQDSVDVLWYYSIVRRVQARAIAILADVIPKRSAVPRPPPRCRQPATPVGVALMASQHKFHNFSGTMRCYVCFERAPLLKSHLIDWLGSPCKVDIRLAYSFFTGAQKPARLPVHRPIPVGRQVVHSTHELHVLKGLMFCGKCGYYAYHRLIHLSEP